MNALPGWRYFRNMGLILIGFVGCLFAMKSAYRAPVHWMWAIPIFYIAYLVWGAFSITHPRRFRYWTRDRPEISGSVYEKVLFKSRDGVTLFGWYLSGRNQAAVILVHGIGGSGRVMEVYAAPLVRAGYSVFLIDLRAHGSSDGDTSTFGVLEAYDVVAAVDYLISRGDIDPPKIGVLGISLGAQAALRGALQSEAIHALVLEGLDPADIQDCVEAASRHERRGKLVTLWRKIMYIIILFQQGVFCFFSGQRPTPVVVEIGKIALRPVLLIACGKYEIYNNRRFHAAAQESCDLWELPKARHAAGLVYEPEEYPKRIVGFFNQALHIS